MANANHDIIDELIIKHLAGETSADEENRLLAWVGESDENRRHFALLKHAFKVSTNHVELPPSENLPIDIEQEWDIFQEKVGQRGKTRRLSPVQLIVRIAASLLFIAITGGVVYYFLQPTTTVFQTQGDTRDVTLPDGSRVMLNRETRLSYDPAFGEKNRIVELEGEAFFQVTPDAAKPFIILSEGARVQVIGTSFDVNAYDSMQSVEVIVETGIVSLAPSKGGRKPVELLPGEKGVVTKQDNRMSIAVNEDLNFRAWSTRHLVFVDQDLLSVFETIERTYNVEITSRTDMPLSCIVTVTFDQQSLESVMRVLESTLNLKYSINGNRIEIIEAGC